MRSPGVVYRRYRQLRRKLLFEKIQQSRQKINENCAYGKVLDYFDESTGTRQVINLCLYACKKNNLGSKKHIDTAEDLDVCTSPGICNAFACRWSKEEVEEDFNKDLRDYSIKEKKYPELALFEWILDKSLHDAQIDPGWFGRLLVRSIIVLENILKSIRRSQKRLYETK